MACGAFHNFFRSFVKNSAAVIDILYSILYNRFEITDEDTEGRGSLC